MPTVPIHVKPNAMEAREPLTPEEHQALQTLEETIRGRIDGFMEVGIALDSIRVRRLYRAEFETFENYVAQRWELARQRAYQIIDASVVANQFRSEGIELKNEAHAAVLACVPKDQRVKFYLTAEEKIRSAGEKLTAARIVQEMDPAIRESSSACRAYLPKPEATSTNAPKPIKAERFESVVENEMTRIATLIEQFPSPKHLLVIDDNLKYLRDLIEERMTIPV
jgi:hypothetical protein